MRSTGPLLRVWLLAACAVSACDGTDTVSISTPRDASTSAPPEGAAPGDAGGALLDAGDASLEPLDASSDAAAADGGDAAVETREEFCARKDREFLRFVEESRGCSVDADCTTVVDCGPNIDGRQVNVSAATTAYALMQERCYGGGFDGPTYGARCEQGQCVEGEQNGCCGCPLDAGFGD